MTRRVRSADLSTGAQSLRRGFTLIELLVVMAIIALLASLLFPAIQQVREGGRRTSCLSNMHNIAIASHNYHATFRTLPSGWISDTGGATGMPPAPLCNVQLQVTAPIQLPIANRQRVSLTDYSVSQEWGWHALLLEQIEERNLQPDYLQPKLPPMGAPVPAGGSNWSRMQQPIEIYTCPSASLPAARPSLLGYTNYRGNMGYWPQNQTALDNGVFYQNSQVDLDRDITDGTSHTMMFGESLFGFWGDALSCCARMRDDYSTPNYFDQFWQSQDACGTNTYFFGFGSFHGELVNVVFADAHESSLPKNTDRAVLQALATRNGGEPQRLP
jgi:prepilin-type N-terminal cleavage/methylation domain-containing protein